MQTAIRAARLGLASLIVALLLPVAQGGANPIAPVFWWPPGQNSQFESFANDIGPVLADDFTPFLPGRADRLSWWGSRASSPFWVVTFIGDIGGYPAFPFLRQKILTGSTFEIGHGLFEFDAVWPEILELQGGTTYWFSVANLDPGWTWAHPAGAFPIFGTQHFGAVYSLGGDPSPIPGPYDGPWFPLADQNFAFRILPRSTPEPATLTLLVVGGAVLALARFRTARPHPRLRARTQQASSPLHLDGDGGGHPAQDQAL
ncbi:MAG: hypothetical protein A3G75_01380 [Verrucomicrobia bacterium RIFCSPLOWO2_12_FULL_64_8]|nr:MAG: hypothetical protein A3G75_01380 [Verrucomicrobia bacterium RIFCSPLOWO2_12_FULL_64_8]